MRSVPLGRFEGRVLTGTRRGGWRSQRHEQFAHNYSADGILDFKDVGKLLVQRHGPQRGAVPDSQQLHRDADPVGGPLDLALHQGVNMQFAAQGRQVGSGARVLENFAGGPNDEIQSHACKAGNQRIGHPYLQRFVASGAV